MTPDTQAAADRRHARTTIARHLAEADVALDAVDGDFVHDMGLYSTIQAVKALRYAVAAIADELAALDPAGRHQPLTDQPCGVIPTPAGRQAVLDYHAIRQQQNPKADTSA